MDFATTVSLESDTLTQSYLAWFANRRVSGLPIFNPLPQSYLVTERESSGKYCGKGRKCWLPEFSSLKFPTIFSYPTHNKFQCVRNFS